MAPPRSDSLRKLSALLFDDSEPSWDVEAKGKCLDDPCRFERTLSEDSTVLGHPLSRNISPGGSDDEAEQAVHAVRHLEATPEAAKLVKGPIVDPGPETHHGHELIAVQPGGEASYVPEDEVAELAVIRACLDSEASELYLVGRDGIAYCAPDGEHIDWERLDAQRSGLVSPPPSPVRRPRFVHSRCPAARALAPLERADDFTAEEMLMEGFAMRRPEGSLPRSPSLKKLSALLFAASTGTASRCAAQAEPEELDMDAVEVPSVAAAQGQPSRSWTDGCSLQ